LLSGAVQDCVGGAVQISLIHRLIKLAYFAFKTSVIR